MPLDLLASITSSYKEKETKEQIESDRVMAFRLQADQERAARSAAQSAADLSRNAAKKEANRMASAKQAEDKAAKRADHEKRRVDASRDRDRRERLDRDRRERERLDLDRRERERLDLDRRERLDRSDRLYRDQRDRDRLTSAVTWNALSALSAKRDAKRDRESANQAAIYALNRKLAESRDLVRRDEDHYDNDDTGEEHFAFHTACQERSATGVCDAEQMSQYPPTRSVCWVHETPPSSDHGTLLSSLVGYWRKRPSSTHEAQAKALRDKVRSAIHRHGVPSTEAAWMQVAAEILRTCIYVWTYNPTLESASKWKVYHGTHDCSLGSAPIYLSRYMSASGKPAFTRVKPHTKGSSSLPRSLLSFGAPDAVSVNRTAKFQNRVLSLVNS
jgi:hypothetical protein